MNPAGREWQSKTFQTREQKIAATDTNVYHKSGVKTSKVVSGLEPLNVSLLFARTSCVKTQNKTKSSGIKRDLG